MAVDVTIAYVFHLLFAGLWAGTILFVTYAVIPSGLDGDLTPELLETVVDRLTTVNRVTAVVALLTGGHLAGNLYTVETLTGTGRGHLVLAMLVLWFVTTALVEVAASRMNDGLSADKVRTPAADGRPFLLGASLLVVLLLVDGGLLASGFGA